MDRRRCYYEYCVIFFFGWRGATKLKRRAFEIGVGKRLLGWCLCGRIFSWQKKAEMSKKVWLSEEWREKEKKKEAKRH